MVVITSSILDDSLRKEKLNRPEGEGTQLSTRLQWSIYLQKLKRKEKKTLQVLQNAAL